MVRFLVFALKTFYTHIYNHVLSFLNISKNRLSYHIFHNCRTDFFLHHNIYSIICNFSSAQVGIANNHFARCNSIIPRPRVTSLVSFTELVNFCSTARSVDTPTQYNHAAEQHGDHSLTRSTHLDGYQTAIS